MDRRHFDSDPQPPTYFGAASAKHSPTIATPPIHALVVDDDEDTRMLLQHILSDLGISVETAKDGEAAVELCVHTSFDVILLDMNLPNMNGPEAIEVIRKNGYSGRVIACTGAGSPEDRSRWEAAGCSAFLLKPFDYGTLLTELGSELDQSFSATKLAQPVGIAGGPLEQVCRNFVAGLPLRLKEVEDAYLEGRWIDLEGLAHRLRNAQIFGFAGISAAATKLERAAQNRQPDACADALRSLEAASENAHNTEE